MPGEMVRRKSPELGVGFFAGDPYPVTAGVGLRLLVLFVGELVLIFKGTLQAVLLEEIFLELKDVQMIC